VRADLPRDCTRQKFGNAARIDEAMPCKIPLMIITQPSRIRVPPTIPREK
jgi:hypothetical protein